MFDYLIIGQGLAGTVLSHTMMQNGKKVFVINKANEHAAYQVSAGLFNPVTGKRLSKTWKAEQLFPFLKNFYQGLENTLSERFIHPMPVYKPFSSIAEQNDWYAKALEKNYAGFVDTEIPKSRYGDLIHNEFGGFETLQSGYVEVKKLVHTFRKYLIDKGLYKEMHQPANQVQLKENFVEVDGIQASRLIFCEGNEVQHNPYFSWLPLRPNKGHVLEIRSEQLRSDVILNKSAFILPADPGKFRAGSTYENHFDDIEVSPKAVSDIKTRLETFLKVPFEVTGAKTGIRPAVSDRKPLLGLHPHVKTLGIFNGLGTKGVSLAPYFALGFLQHLETGEDLDPEVSITRFISKYLE